MATIDFEALINKHVGEDGNIPAASISKLASQIASAVGREFVAKDRYAAKLDEIETLKGEKQEADDKATAAARWEKKYTDLKTDYDKFKADTDAKARLSAVKGAYRKMLESSGIDAKRIDTIIRATQFDGMKLGDDGKLVNAADLQKAIDTDWADFKVTTRTEGAKIETPPANNAPAKRTKAEIMAIKDTGERQRAIAENHELFGI